ncbi:restriction endonuclease subunit S [Micromonospora sp. WMMC273]|uniref:restriction endonuclease subunit S n=1 Tax=Micromonospora sp. WMMC273 TaxID=3015157 RepID=UPI0022B68C5C|nr:restriction endonuclease subunit S [Micromonospora sp. WMMC273]MCZ7475358.1 restriction endonuclease subunit S [Micromonospora sp. WMMC273]
MRFPGNDSGIKSAANYISRAQARRLGARIVPPGSVVFPKVGAALLGNARARTLRECFIDNNMMAIVPHGGDSRYWLHLFSTIDLGELSPGGPLPYVSEAQVREISVPIPPLEEQRRIADFLDDQVTLLRRAESLLIKQEQLVGEREASLLQQETSISDAPAIAVKRIVSRLTSGPRGWGSLIADTGIPFIRIGNIPRSGIALLPDNLAFVDVPGGAERERTRTRAGDVLVSITADIGSVGLVEEWAIGGNVSQHVALLRPIVERCHPRWLAYSLKAPSAKMSLTMSSYGGAKVGLGLTNVAETVIALPSIAEQDRRVRRLDEAMKWADSLRCGLNRQRALLVERRQALIKATVTGQIDVATAREVGL